MKSKKILALNAFYAPGFRGGGSIRALYNLIAHLREDFDFEVVTSVYDLNERIPYLDEECAEVVKSEGYMVHYLSRGMGYFRKMQAILRRDWDIVYLNSFFSPCYSLLPLLILRFSARSAATVVLAPRGELMEGALNSNRNKMMKKKMFFAFARFVGLFKGVVFHSTSEEESQGIARLHLGESKIVLAPDLPPTAGSMVEVGAPKDSGILRVVFISRIDPKKNLDFVLHVLSEVSATIRLDVVGPIADVAYWNQCQAIIKSLPQHVEVAYLGAIPHDEILSTFASHDLFFFPTYAENNGYVILESLLAGCPVLLSDRTPWRGLEVHGVGVDLPLGSTTSFATTIEQMAKLSPDEHMLMRRNAQAYGRGRLLALDEVKSTKNMFLEANR